MHGKAPARAPNPAANAKKESRTESFFCEMSLVPSSGAVFSGSMSKTLPETGIGVAHGKLRVTTAGEIRAGGGSVQLAPEVNSNRQNKLASCERS